MISASSLGSYGRIGNQLFQLHAVLGAAERNNTQAAFPVWSYEQYFEIELPHGPLSQHTYKEPHFHYEPIAGTDIDLYGYWQSEKYFPSTGSIKFKQNWLQQLHQHPAYRKKTIGIHVRRGDYVGHELYAQLPISWFISAMCSVPDWRQFNIVVVSDDYDYCKIHFGCLPNVFFMEGNDVEDLAYYSLCDIQILSNSSFSWWGCRLSEKQNGIHSGRLFAGAFIDKDIKDFYPERWALHESNLIDLQDMTFTIPVFMDSKDRKQNLDLCVCILQSQFKTNIIIGEQGSETFGYMKQWCQYRHFTCMPYFHRTKMLNDMAMQADTPYIVNWDCDVIIPPMQVLLAVIALREGKEMVFPYDGRFSRWERRAWFKIIEARLDIGVTAGVIPVGSRGKSIEGQTSVGGAVMFNRDSFIAGGMENEHMISFGPEDCERNDRFTMLGFVIGRIAGCLYHIDHWCGPDSSRLNPHFRANHIEIEKIRAMDVTRLKGYIETWPWIPPGAIRKLTFEQVTAKVRDVCNWAENETGLTFTFTAIGIDIGYCSEPDKFEARLTKVNG